LLTAALRRLTHAYLFVGPRGSGKRAAAAAFAAEILAAGSSDAEAARHRRLALAEQHPDLEVVEREGAFLSRDQARHIVERAARSPVEGRHKVIVVPEIQLALDAAPVLLKTLEEPPASAVFVVLAEEVPPELATVASRCILVRFAPLSESTIAAQLEAEGATADAAKAAAGAAGGDLGRARVLVTDAGLGERVALWRSVPDRLDGTGAAAASLVDAVAAQLDEAMAPMDDRHQAEVADLAEREQRYGLPAGARKTLAARHQRERRRFRTDELRFGLALLARTYRDRIVAGLDAPAARRAQMPDAPDPFAPLAAIIAAAEALDRNANESLLLLRLFLTLEPLR
jgi:DNA polymerase-3 subunit delta'